MMFHIIMVLIFVVLTLKNAKWLKNLAGAHSEECGSASTTHRPIFDLRLPVMIMMVAYLHICIFAYLLTKSDHRDGCICIGGDDHDQIMPKNIYALGCFFLSVMMIFL